MADMWGQVRRQGKFQVKSREFLAIYLANFSHLPLIVSSSVNLDKMLEEPTQLSHKFPFFYIQEVDKA